MEPLGLRPVTFQGEPGDCFLPSTTHGLSLTPSLPKASRVWLTQKASGLQKQPGRSPEATEAPPSAPPHPQPPPPAPPRLQLLTVETFTRSGLAPSQSGQALSLGLSPGPGASSSRRSCPCFRAPTEPSRGRGALSLRLTALAQSSRETVNPRPSEHRHTTFLNYILRISIPVLSSADMALDRMSVLPQTGYIQLGRCNNVSILMFPTGVCFHSVGTVGQ